MVMELNPRIKCLERQTYHQRRVFLFEQIIIYSEEVEKKKNNMSTPEYVYKTSIKVSIESVCMTLVVSLEINNVIVNKVEVVVNKCLSNCKYTLSEIIRSVLVLRWS